MIEKHDKETWRSFDKESWRKVIKRKHEDYLIESHNRKS